MKADSVKKVAPWLAFVAVGAGIYWEQSSDTGKNRPPQTTVSAQPKDTTRKPEQEPLRLLTCEELTPQDFPTFVTLKKTQLVPFARGTHAKLTAPTKIDTDDGFLRQGAAGETFEVIEERAEQRMLYCNGIDAAGKKTTIHFSSLAAHCDATEAVSAGTMVDFLKLQGKEILVKHVDRKFWVSIEETDLLEMASRRRMHREAESKQIKETFKASSNERGRVEKQLAEERQKMSSLAKQTREEELRRRKAEAGPAPTRDPGKEQACPEVLQYLKETLKNPDSLRFYNTEAPVLAMYPGGEDVNYPIVYGAKVFRKKLQFGWVVYCDYSEQIGPGGTIRIKGWFFIRAGKVEQCFFDKNSFYKADE